MTVDTAQPVKSSLRVQFAEDGTRKVVPQAADDGPRPLDDAELEAVAGGGSYQVSFQDGCTVDVSGASITTHEKAAIAAQEVHQSFMGHSSTVTAVTNV